MYWVDSHCHINDKAFAEDLDVVLNNMKTNNVKEAMIVSSFVSDYLKSLKIVDEEIVFKRSLGIYPGDVDDFSEELFSEYLKYIKEADALGEIGLDYYYGKDNKEKQIEVFKRQLRVAKELNKPIIVHSRDAIQDTYDLLKEYRCAGVMHCYSNSAEMAKEFVKLGYYISISGSVTWKKAKEPLEVIKVVPLERLLIETDCPYLSPVPMRGKRNEPANVVYTGKKICEELSISEEAFKKVIVENYHRLFG